MAAGAAALFFDLGEVRTLIPVGLGVVKVGDGIEARGFGGAAGNNGVRHADDGRRIHAATQLGEDGAVRAEPAAHGFTEDGSEMLFVFPIGPVTDSLVRIEIPVLSDGVLSGPYEDGRRRWDGMDPDVGRQMSRREKREPA